MRGSKKKLSGGNAKDRAKKASHWKTNTRKSGQTSGEIREKGIHGATGERGRRERHRKTRTEKTARTHQQKERKQKKLLKIRLKKRQETRRKDGPVESKQRKNRDERIAQQERSMGGEIGKTTTTWDRQNIWGPKTREQLHQ